MLKFRWVIGFIIISIFLEAGLHSIAESSSSFRVKEYSQFIPEKYKTVYKENQTVMNELRQRLESNSGKNPDACIYSTEIPHANCNRGPLLLTKSNWTESLLFLKQIKNLGFQAVTLDIHFPLLCASFHKTEQEYIAYLQYYKNLIQAIRNNGMKVYIESQTIFTQPEFSSLPVEEYYKTLTLEEYKKGRLETLIVISRELKPDYLTIGCEPSTEAKLSGQPFHEYEQYINFMKYLLEGLQDHRSSLKLGAGFGTWEKEYIQFTRDYTQLLSLDFVNLHVYPLSGGQGNRMLQIAQACQRINRPILIEEAWLYKATSDELQESSDIASSAEFFSRDCYSFFQPLDEQFIQLMLLFSAKYPVACLNFFWSHYFFGYLQYENVADMTYPQLMKALNTEIYQNYHQSVITNTGCTLYCFFSQIPIEQAFLGYGSTKYPVSKRYEFFHGTIEDFMIFNRPLTNEEVQDLYRTQYK